MKNRLLIHACCAPCLVAVYDDTIKNMTNMGIDEFDVIWHNTNIHPKIEYEKRKETFISYVNSMGKTPIMIDEYNMNKFISDVVNLDKTKYKMRCEYCYVSRLEKVFEYAKENGYTHVTTTLLISPFQKHDVIKKVCESLAKKYDVIFLYKDYRSLFEEGQQKAKELGMYRQKYCGCIYSIDESGYRIDIKKKIRNGKFELII